VTVAASGIKNGGFETGLTSWVHTGTASTTSAAHSGAFAGRAGAATPTTTSTLAQTFIAPYGSTQVGIWYQQSCPDTVAHAWTTITVRDITAAVTRTALPKTCTNSGQWVHVTAAVQPGHKYRLTLLNRDDNDLGDGAYTAFDDITTA